jgi:hypothetical protein
LEFIPISAHDDIQYTHQQVNNTRQVTKSEIQTRVTPTNQSKEKEKQSTAQPSNKLTLKHWHSLIVPFFFTIGVRFHGVLLQASLLHTVEI